MKKIDKFVALVLAADRTANDPVAIKSGMACKAFTPICGIPMIIRVLDALEASGMIRSIILCGPPESTLPGCTELEQRIGRGEMNFYFCHQFPYSSTHFEQLQPNGVELRMSQKRSCQMLAAK